MPYNSKSVNKQDIVDIIRKAFVTKEDAEQIYEEIHDLVLDSLLEDRVVNLFGCVTIRTRTRKEKIVHNSFGIGDVIYPEGIVLKSSIYPRLKNEWQMVNQ